MPAKPPRFVPELPLPPYTHIPGQTPHPVSDPRGHSFGAPPKTPEPLDPDRWQTCVPYRYGLDLFNHGYYWEAHEVWEGLWHASGRTGRTAKFLKGLIKLAAAGVKVRAHQPRGVQTHACRAAAIFRDIASELGSERASYLGLCLADLIAAADRVVTHPPTVSQAGAGAVGVVFDFLLEPNGPAGFNC
jgi:hypothetical protein